MKVNITVTIDIDAKGWVEAFGCDSSQTAIRKDVVDFYSSGIREDLAERGLEVKRRKSHR